MPALDEAFGPRPPLTTEAACEMFVRGGAITRARRKIRYSASLTNALDLRCVPRALDAVLAHARESRRTNGK